MQQLVAKFSGFLHKRGFQHCFYENKMLKKLKFNPKKAIDKILENDNYDRFRYNLGSIYLILKL